jgi:hypothetical protein
MGKYADESLFNIVGAGREKGKLAKSGDLLIDDKPENCEIFRQAGGMAILHTDTNKTIAELKKYYD